jgi:hypothetical protein
MKSIGADIISINEPNLNLRHPYIHTQTILPTPTTRMGALQVHLRKQQHQHRHPKTRRNHPRRHRQTHQPCYRNDHRPHGPMDLHHTPRPPLSQNHHRMRVSSCRYPWHLRTYNGLHTTIPNAQTTTTYQSATTPGISKRPLHIPTIKNRRRP